MTSQIVLDELDTFAVDLFPGLVVRKDLLRRNERLLMGGIWAEIGLRYDDGFVFKGQNRPFFIDKIRPIQLSNRDISGFVEGRKRLTDRGKWIDLLLRSLGYEPTHPYFTHR